ncbi:hypothetical protein C1646_756657 [Rhizophagus diaphanus]|nr:hypothetical protein C1646_756657 [Rhizophagus diaphanus] [Rhizophagus sp. MUCL 43196]
MRKCKDRNCCSQLRAPEIYNILSANNGFLPPITKSCDGHFLNLVHTLKYFGEKLPGYDEHYPSISQDQYPSFVCQKCFRYYPTKMFLKLHIKTTHSNEKAPKSGLTNEKTEFLPRDYGCNVENTKDNEISNYEIRNVQVFQGEKPVKKVLHLTESLSTIVDIDFIVDVDAIVNVDSVVNIDANADT